MDLHLTPSVHRGKRQYVKAAGELVKEPTASLLFDSIFRRMRCAVDLVERYSHNVKAIS